MSTQASITQSLDQAEPTEFAPVKGTDTRRHLPKRLFRKKPWRFCLKFWFAMGFIAVGYLAIATSDSLPLKAAVVIAIGLLYAHLIELQHEALHEHAFNSRLLNRMYGVICGVFMLSSYSAYKYEHLRHHASLGKPGNREFFNYRFSELDSLKGFAKAAFHLGRYLDVLGDIGRAIVGAGPSGVTHRADRRKIVSEYRFFAVVLFGAALYTVITGDLFFLWAWVIPAVAIAEPTHFLIEMPEHFGLNTQNNPDVLSNTRTIGAGRIAQWFTNYNNLHTAHHFHQGIPMAQATELNNLMTSRYKAVEPSYLTFYRKVIRGDIKYGSQSDTCMTR